VKSPIPPNIKMVGYPWRDFMDIGEIIEIKLKDKNRKIQRIS